LNKILEDTEVHRYKFETRNLISILYIIYAIYYQQIIKFLLNPISIVPVLPSNQLNRSIVRI